MDYPTLLLLLAGTAHLTVGCFVFGRNPKNAVNRAFLVMAVLFAVWALLGAAVYLPELGTDPVVVGRWAHAVALFLWAGFVSLVLVYPEGDTRTPLSLRVLVWVVSGTIAAVAIFTPDLIKEAEVQKRQLRAVYGPLLPAYFGCIGLFLCWILGESLYRRKHSRGKRRVQIDYLLTGLALAGLSPLPSNMVAPLLGIHSMVWVGPCSTLIFTAMVAHAVVHHRLMGIRLVVGRGVANVLALLIAALLFFGLLWLMNVLLVGTGTAKTSIAMLATALLFQPLRNRVQSAVLRYFHRPTYDYQSTVRDASRALTATLDLNAAIDYLLRTVCATLRVERGLLLLHDRAAGGFRLVGAHSGWAEQVEEEEAPNPGGLARISPLAIILEEVQEPVVREELAVRLPGERGRAIERDMEHFGADVAVPLLSGNVLWAILLVGPKISGDVFTSQDIDILSTLGAEAASAVVNAQLHEDAMQADRLATLGGLAAGIAHEVKNPLVAVRTFAELLPEKHDDVEFREQFSQVVVREVDRIDRLIGQLLHYARPQPPRLEPVDLNELIRETLQLLSYEAARCSVQVETEFDQSLPRAMADASQMRQVVLNIALNAIQAMPGGGILRITTRLLQGRTAAPYLLPAEERIEIVFANTGPRIPEAHLARLFEPFFSTRSEGTGLGLSICKRIVTEHHGEIRAGTTEEGLTAFVIHLPAVCPAEIDPEVCLLEEDAGGLVAVGWARG